MNERDVARYEFNMGFWRISYSVHTQEFNKGSAVAMEFPRIYTHWDRNIFFERKYLNFDKKFIIKFVANFRNKLYDKFFIEIDHKSSFGQVFT